MRNTGDTSLASCIVAVTSPEYGGIVLGRAILVTERLAVMVRPDRQSLVPEGSLALRPATGLSQEVSTDLVGTTPMSGPGPYLVLLVAREPVEGTTPADLVDTGDLWGRHIHVLGFPAGYDDGVLSRAVARAADASGLVQLDPEAGEYRLGPGFAGSAAWDPTSGGVVGILAETGTMLIPSRTLIEALGELTDDADLAGATRPPVPFPGLTAYTEPDSTTFHGRGAETSELLAMTHGQRWICVVGPSGAGKSSLVLAGLVPRARAGGSTISVIRGSMDGPAPDDTVSRAIGRALEEREATHLLVLDQVEEILSAPSGEAALARLVQDGIPRGLRVVLTMRPDTYADLQANDRLSRLTLDPFLLSPPDADTVEEILKAALDNPAVHIETGLLHRIVQDTATVASPLPLLSHAMHELWSRSWAQSRAGRTPFTLTSSGYHALGGVGGAIDRSATRVWNTLTEEEQQHGKHLLLRLISKEDRDAPAIRRSVSTVDLPSEQRDVAHRLASAGILVIAGTPADPVVGLMHETILRQWHLLASLVHDHTTLLTWRTGLERDAERWHARGRHDDQSPGSDSLDEADARLATLAGAGSTDLLDEITRDYLATGIRRLRHRTRARALTATALAAVGALAIVLATSAVSGWATAREAQQVADSHSLVREAQNLETTDPALAVMTALAAYETAPTRESRNQLMRAYMTHSYDTRVLDHARLNSVEVSGDGEVALHASGYSVDITTNALSGPSKRHSITSDTRIRYAELADAGNRAVIFYDHGGGAWFDIDRSAHQGLSELHPLAAAGVSKPAAKNQEPLEFFGSGTTWEEFHGWAANVEPVISQDGRFAAARVWNHAVVWSLDTGAWLHQMPIPRRTDDIWFGTDAKTLIAGIVEGRGDDAPDLAAMDMVSGKTWDVGANVEAVTVAANGSAVVTCRKNGDEYAIFQRYDSADGSRTSAPVQRRASYCPTPVIDSGGKLLYDGEALTNLDTGRTLSAPRVDVVGDKLIENDGALYGRGWTRGAVVYREIPWYGEDGATAISSALAADGARLYVVRKDGTLEARSLHPDDDETTPPLASTRRPEPLWEFEGADSLQENRSGALLLGRTGRDEIVVRDAETLAVRTTIRAADPPPIEQPNILSTLTGGVSDPGPQIIERATTEFTYHFSGDDVVTISGTTVQLWESESGTEIASLDVTRFAPTPAATDSDSDQALSVRAGPGPRPGTIQIITDDQPGVQIVDIASGRVERTLDLPQDTTAVQFDRSGKYLGVIRSGSIVELWRRDPLERMIGPLPSLTDATTVPFYAGFTDDEGIYAVGTGNQLTIYDINRRTTIESYSLANPTTDEGMGAFLDVSRNLDQIIYITPDLTGTVTPLDPVQWRDHLCEALAGRDFTNDEIASLPGNVRRGLICQA